MQRVIWLIAVAGLVSGPVAMAADSPDQAEVSAPARTGKERLTDKASDEQRVNDCKVPLSRRTRQRPSGCRTR